MGSKLGNIRGRVNRLYEKQVTPKKEIEENAQKCLLLSLKGRGNEVTYRMKELYKLYSSSSPNSIMNRLKI